MFKNKYMLKELQKISNVWWAIVVIVGLITQWVNFHSRLQAIEKIQSEQNPIYLQIQKDIVEIKTTLEFIKLNMK